MSPAVGLFCVPDRVLSRSSARNKASNESCAQQSRSSAPSNRRLPRPRHSSRRMASSKLPSAMKTAAMPIRAIRMRASPWPGPLHRLHRDGPGSFDVIAQYECLDHELRVVREWACRRIAPEPGCLLEARIAASAMRPIRRSKLTRVVMSDRGDDVQGPWLPLRRQFVRTRGRLRPAGGSATSELPRDFLRVSSRVATVVRCERDAGSGVSCDSRLTGRDRGPT